MATKEERDKRLDALKTATQTWYDQRVKEIENSVASSKRILKGRTGAERLAAAATDTAASAIADEVDDFLSGG